MHMVFLLHVYVHCSTFNGRNGVQKTNKTLIFDWYFSLYEELGNSVFFVLILIIQSIDNCLFQNIMACHS
jgi:hypothetical protein